MEKMRDVVMRICCVFSFIFMVLVVPAVADTPDKVVAAGETINLSATVTDSDCDYTSKPCGQKKNDSTVTTTWSATGGSFPSGNTGNSVAWKAPNSPGNVTITATANNSQSSMYPDGSASDSILVQVTTNGCPAGQVRCSDGQCRVSCGGCVQDSDCNTGYMCEDSVCVPNGGNCNEYHIFGIAAEVNGSWVSETAPGCSVKFIARTTPRNCGDDIQWQIGEGTTPVHTGRTFTTSFSDEWSGNIFAIGSGENNTQSKYFTVRYKAINSSQDLYCCLGEKGLTPKSGYTPQSNGCSSPFGNNPTRWFPPNPFCVNTSFVGDLPNNPGPCDNHDFCYGTCFNNLPAPTEEELLNYKTYCDGRLGANAQAVCDLLVGVEYDACHGRCEDWANTYCVAVDICGYSAFINAQVNACMCGSCISYY